MIYYRLTKILCVILCVVFIIFSIMITDVCGYGGSSSSGTRGMAPSNIDPFSNIVKYETRDENLVHNESIEYPFSSPELSIYKVIVNGKENEFEVSVRIESLRNTSKYAKPAPGIVYRNENIWVGSKRLNYIAVKFKVKNSWMEEKGMNETIRPYLLKWNGTTWLVLTTNMTGKDGLYTYFEAPKAGNSYIGIFAISGPSKIMNNRKVNNTWPTNVTDIEAEKDEVVIPDIQEIEIENSPGFDTIVTIISIILSLIYIDMRYMCKKR